MVSEFFTSHAKQQDWELLPFPSPPAAYSVNKKALANATKLGFCLFFFFFSSAKVPKLCISVCICPGSARAGQPVPTVTLALTALCPLPEVGTVGLKSLRQTGLQSRSSSQALNSWDQLLLFCPAHPVLEHIHQLRFLR